MTRYWTIRTLWLLGTLAGCSFDFERSVTATDGAPRTDSSVEAGVPSDGPGLPPDQPRPLDSEPDAAAVAAPVTLRTAPAGQIAYCPSGTAIGGGTECSSGGIEWTIPIDDEKDRPVGWTGECFFGGVATNHVICLGPPLAEKVQTSTNTNSGTQKIVEATCPANTKVIGGGCRCAESTGLWRSYPQDGKWTCVCSAIQEHSAEVICLPTAAAAGHEILDGSPAGETDQRGCKSHQRLIGGGCHSPDTALRLSAPSTAEPRLWHCDAPNGQVGAYAICLDKTAL